MKNKPEEQVKKQVNYEKNYSIKWQESEGMTETKLMCHVWNKT